MVKVVIPMAGRGSRFSEQGYSVPKPFIDVAGQPMFARAIASLPLDLVDRILFVCLDEYRDVWPLEQEVTTRYAAQNPEVISLPDVTEGQACTVLAAREFIDNDDMLIIYNIDTYFESGLGDRLRDLQPGVDGIITVFEAHESHWSFARTDDTGAVVEVAEKRPISKWATVGMYHFTRGRDFVAGADELIRRDLRVKNEFYVMPVYGILIGDGRRFELDVAERVVAMGTPAELTKSVPFFAAGNATRLARS